MGDIRLREQPFLGDELPSVNKARRRGDARPGDCWPSVNKARQRGEFLFGDNNRDLLGDALERGEFSLGDFSSWLRAGEFFTTGFTEKSRARTPGDRGTTEALKVCRTGEKSSALREGDAPTGIRLGDKARWNGEYCGLLGE